MVRPEKAKNDSGESSSSKYTGVRKRKWGKYVSEIRLPNCRERIWLGSYDSAEKAARAFDAALFCLRGPSAKFNFPDCPPDIPGGQSLQPSEIQAVAAHYARTGPQTSKSPHSSSTTSSSSFELCLDSPSASVSNEPTHMDMGTETTLDSSFIDQFSTMGSDYNVTSSYAMYPAFDDFYNEYYVPPPPIDNYYPEEQYDTGYSHDSLWNF